MKKVLVIEAGDETMRLIQDAENLRTTNYNYSSAPPADAEECQTIVNYANSDEFSKESLKYGPLMKFMEKIVKASNSVLGKESCEMRVMKYRYENSYAIYATFKMGDIELRNDLGYKFLLREVYIETEFAMSTTTGNYKLKSLRMMRTRYNTLEAAAGFMYSHATRIYGVGGNAVNMQWSGCCLGTSSLYQEFSKRYRTVSFFDAEQFIFILQNYVSWESLTGGPYVKMEDVITNTIGESVNVKSKNHDITKEALENFTKIVETGSLEASISDSEIFITPESIDEALLNMSTAAFHRNFQYVPEWRENLKVTQLTGESENGIDFRGKSMKAITHHPDKGEYDDVITQMFCHGNPEWKQVFIKYANDLLYARHNELIITTDKPTRGKLTLKEA